MSASPPPTKERILITVVAAGGVVLTFGVFNVAGWAVRWADSIALALLFCGVALFAEVLGVNLAISIERALRRPRRFDRAAGCLFALAVCAIVNGVSGHNAWTTFERQMFAPQVAAEQAEIDARRAPMLLELAEAKAQAARLNEQVLAITETGRAENWPGDRVRLQAAPLLPLLTAARADAADKQAKLDAMPLVAPERRIAADWTVWAFFIAIELMKATVLWAVGAGIERQRAAAPLAPFSPPAQPAPASAHAPQPASDREARRRAQIDAELAHLRTLDVRLAAVWRMRKREYRSVEKIAEDLKLEISDVNRALAEAQAALDAWRAPKLAKNVTPLRPREKATA